VAALVPPLVAQLRDTTAQMGRVDGAVTGAKAGDVQVLGPPTQDGAQYLPVVKAAVGVVLVVAMKAGEGGKSTLQFPAACAIETFRL